MLPDSKGARTAEIDSKAQHLVIDAMGIRKTPRRDGSNYSASMRLGGYHVYNPKQLQVNHI